MKIITGKYKNLIIPSIKKYSYRPITSKLRESIFSILLSKYFNKTQLMNITVLDLFSGTGILGFEALSRGARHITLIDNNRLCLTLAKQFAQKIKIANKIHTMLADIRNLTQARLRHNLVFINPPYYQKNIISQSLYQLLKNNWLANNAIIIIQTIHKIKLPNNNFDIRYNKLHSNTNLLILTYSTL